MNLEDLIKLILILKIIYCKIKIKKLIWLVHNVNRYYIMLQIELKITLKEFKIKKIM
jgi:hypothetical protein